MFYIEQSIQTVQFYNGNVNNSSRKIFIFYDVINFNL